MDFHMANVCNTDPNVNTHSFKERGPGSYLTLPRIYRFLRGWGVVQRTSELGRILWDDWDNCVSQPTAPKRIVIHSISLKSNDLFIYVPDFTYQSLLNWNRWEKMG